MATDTSGILNGVLQSRVWGALCPRRANARNGDHFDVAASPSCVILALSDGAGGALYGAQGALKATQIFLDVAAVYQPQLLMPPERPAAQQALLLELVRAVQRQYLQETSEADAGDYACTLLGAVVTPERLWAIQVGDGAFVARQGGEPMQVLFTPAQDFINEPLFLGEQDVVDRAQIGVFERPDFLGLLSDGLAAVALERLPDLTPYPGFWTPLERGVVADLDAALQADPPQSYGVDVPHAGLATFLSSEAVARRVHDDRSLIVAAFRGGV